MLNCRDLKCFSRFDYLAGMTMNPLSCNSQTNQYASNPETGMVNSQAQAIRSTTVQLSAPQRLAAPTPMIEDEMLCVVETGIPK